NPIGRIFGDPFVQRIDSVPSRRHPDLQVIFHTNPGQLTETEMIGPADLCIEVVSAGNAADDYGDKFLEYEKGGVREYWIIDHRRRTSLFYQLDETGVYQNHPPDVDGYYQTPLLPKLNLHVPILWQDELPGYFAIGRAIQVMFGIVKN
ncbi:MAG: Uma2 family endonuclease, partial [Chloroflexi bacterium]|nr:Uma2 family endonuclease [Chloroflexota bacterium]